MPNRIPCSEAEGTRTEEASEPRDDGAGPEKTQSPGSVRVLTGVSRPSSSSSPPSPSLTGGPVPSQRQARVLQVRAPPARPPVLLPQTDGVGVLHDDLVHPGEGVREQHGALEEAHVASVLGEGKHDVGHLLYRQNRTERHDITAPVMSCRSGETDDVRLVNEQSFDEREH